MMRAMVETTGQNTAGAGAVLIHNKDNNDRLSFNRAHP
jgi:hypothetical protein